MRAILTTSLLLFLVVSISRCGFASAVDYKTLVLGTWEGRILTIAKIDGQQNEYPILFRINFQKDGSFSLEEFHENEPQNNFRITSQYEFVTENSIRIANFEEGFVITKLSSNEISFSIAAKDKMNKSAPCLY